jgi:hypothetical protein
MEYAYKEKEISFGSSDVSRLIVDSPNQLEHLEFGSDGAYKAYIVGEKTEIPSHYQKKLEMKNWVKIYDDSGLVASFHADKIIFYRAGEFTAIVQLISHEA